MNLKNLPVTSSTITTTMHWLNWVSATPQLTYSVMTATGTTTLICAMEPMTQTASSPSTAMDALIMSATTKLTHTVMTATFMLTTLTGHASITGTQAVSRPATAMDA